MSGLARYEQSLSRSRAQALLAQIGDLRAGVIGDVCLDVYWEADMTLSTLSRETPHYTQPVVEERFSPGAAGNAAANLKAIGCREVFVCSVIGQDWRGDQLIKELAARGIDDRYLVRSSDWHTPAYCKPIRVGLQGVKQEQPRIDFQNFMPLSTVLADQLADQVDQMAAVCDVIVVTDQLSCGVVSARIREKLAEWAARGLKIIVDSREQIGAYRQVLTKPNEIEAIRWFEPQSSGGGRSHAEWAEVALRLAAEVQGPCCLTLGSEGALWAEDGQVLFVPTKPAEPPLDIVGAGDCFASALVSALGAGCSGPEAVAFAHRAASIVVRKIGTTGTATPQELLDACEA